jgi:hypothetical protein
MLTKTTSKSKRRSKQIEKGKDEKRSKENQDKEIEEYDLEL